ncbi:uncharacterized protein LOC141609206 [Silene latifolia]|uniref:uncharacterized protein LOC141609206 n=1 Tax=Silene latifolia TaxID=37657 RepID=UPI003D7712BF
MEQNLVLVMSTSLDSEDGSTYGIPHRIYCAEFHLVDLKTKEIHLKYVPSLPQCVATSSLVAVDKFLYIFGGPSSSYDTSHFDPQYFDSHLKLFMGASRLSLDLDLDPSQVPKPVLNCSFPFCISLATKIYSFGSVVFIPEVFDPMNGPQNWEAIVDYPSDLKDCQVSDYPIPDPSNTRILMHLTGGKLPSPSIYSYSPTRGWEPIIRDFRGWTRVAAVVDNVIFFHSLEYSGVVRGFDIQSGHWLRVRWAASKSGFTGSNMNKSRMEFDALLPMGDRMLCLAVWTFTSVSDDLGRSRPTIRMTFLKYSVKRINSTLLTLHPDSSFSCDLPATSKVLNFLPV